MTDEEKKTIDKLKNGKKYTLVEIIRVFKKEGIENFRITRKEYLETILNLLEKQDNRIKEIEELKEKNKKLENDLKDITKKYMEAESVKFWYNYIHKDKIRKMLQELEDRRNKQLVIGYWSKKAMLEKLLKEE